jgi:LPXTG-motif cell wall-anchored protein
MGGSGVARWTVATAIGVGAAVGLLGSVRADLAHAGPTPDPSQVSRSATAVTPMPDPGAQPPRSAPVPPATEATPPSRAEARQTPLPAEPVPSTALPSVTSKPVQPQTPAEPSQRQPLGSVSPTPGPVPSPAGETPAPQDGAERSTAAPGLAAAAEPVADDRLYAVVVSRCAGDSAAAVEVSLSLLGKEDLALTYVVTDDDAVTRTGAVTLRAEDEGAEFELDSSLPTGTYHLDLFAEGGEEPITVQNFEVLRCLVADVQCKQLTLTNPATNPTVGVYYGEGPGEQEELEEFDLRPGQSQVLRTDQGVIQWGAGALVGGAAENFAVASAGEGDSRNGGTLIPADCGQRSPSPRADATPAASDPSGDVGLADTGGSSDSVVALIAGALLVAAGGLVILGRRAPREPSER